MKKNDLYIYVLSVSKPEEMLYVQVYAGKKQSKINTKFTSINHSTCP